jgi:hypothetical protein
VSGRGDIDGQRHVFLEERQGAEPSGWARGKQEECRQSVACGIGQLAVNRRAFDTAVRMFVRAPLRSSTPARRSRSGTGNVMYARERARFEGHRPIEAALADGSFSFETRGARTRCELAT